MTMTFIPLALSRPHGGLPVAVFLRVNDEMRSRMVAAAALVRTGALHAVSIDPGPADAVRFVRTIGYTSENGMAPIPGWMDDPASDLRLAGRDHWMTADAETLMNLEISAQADYRDDCELFDASGMDEWGPVAVTVSGKTVPQFAIEVAARPGPVRTEVQPFERFTDVFPPAAIERAAEQALQAEGWEQVVQFARAHGFETVPKLLAAWKERLGPNAHAAGYEEPAAVRLEVYQELTERVRRLGYANLESAISSMERNRPGEANPTAWPRERR